MMSSNSDPVKLSLVGGSIASANLNHKSLGDLCAKMPVPLRELRALALGIFGENLNAFLLNLDASLLTAASAVHNQADQDAYYFAMRALRERKIDVLQAFNESLTRGIVTLFYQEMDDKTPQSIDDLAVLENEATDELLAMQYLAKKSYINNKKPLQQLSSRLEVFCACSLNADSFPLSPHAIVMALSEGLARLGLSIRARLKIYELFDFELQKLLPASYLALNKHLADNGILPSASDMSRKPKKSALSKPKNPTKEDNSGFLLGGNHNFDHFIGAQSREATLADELAFARDALRKHLAPSAADMSAPSSSAAPAPASSMSTLLPMFEQLEAMASDAGIPRRDGALGSTTNGPSPLSRTIDAEQVLALMSELNASFKRSGHTQHHSPSKALINELMAASFAEESLALPVKTLLGRMEIAVAQVLDANPELLHNEHHSARLLLNALLRSGSVWHKNEAEHLAEDPLYKKMTEIVSRAVAEAPNNEAVFSELLADFDSFTRREQNRLGLIEKRLLAVEEGRVKSEQARSVVSQIIADVCKNKTCCGAINELIHRAWHQVLFVEYLKHGEDSLEFVAMLQVLRETLDATLAQPSASIVNKLVGELKAGLNIIAFDAFDADRIVLNIKAAIKRAKPSDLQSSPKPQSQGLAVNVKMNAPSLLAEKPPVTARVTAQAMQAVIGDHAQVKASLQGVNAKNIEQINTNTDDSTDPFLTLAKSLHRGAWFDFTDVARVTKRCRLAAVIDTAGLYIFVTRQGQKLIERKLHELAEILKSGDLQIIDNSHLFDNALEKVIESLRAR